ncbi:MAG: hypothetical protein AB7E63_09335 [Parachlamydia sp.]|jgi:hypothetical protein
MKYMRSKDRMFSVTFTCCRDEVQDVGGCTSEGLHIDEFILGAGTAALRKK